MKLILKGCILGLVLAGAMPSSHLDPASISKVADKPQSKMVLEANAERKAINIDRNTFQVVVKKQPIKIETKKKHREVLLASRGIDSESLRKQKQEEEMKYCDLPLSKSLQKHIWKLSKQYGIQYELILAVIATESDFNISEDNGIAAGLMQINHTDGTLQHLGKQVGIGSDPNAYDPYDNVTMGVWYLNYLRDRAIQKGYREHADSCMLIFYNRGEGGGSSYIRNNGTDCNYTRKVYENLDKIERGIRP